MPDNPDVPHVSPDRARAATDDVAPARSMPRWVVPAIALFWLAFLASDVLRAVVDRLSGLLLVLAMSVFLALAIEPAVNRLAARGWPRGRATLIVIGSVLVAVFVFIGAMGTLIGTQVAQLLQNSDRYITDTVDFVNSTFGTEVDAREVIAEFSDPEGRVQRFIDSQADDALRLSVQAVGVVFQAFTVVLFTFYLVADGPRLRRVICARLRPSRQARVLRAWDLAITKTGGYLYSRALLALISAFFHWVLFQSIGIQAPIPLALWVGLVSQFLPVVGTYIAGVLPVLIMFLDSPLKALVIAAAIVVYQQVENYLFAPRITARTMELHPALAFGAALGGASLLGFVGAVLALPAAAMIQALLGDIGERYDIVDDPLVALDGSILPRPAVDGESGDER